MIHNYFKIDHRPFTPAEVTLKFTELQENYINKKRKTRHLAGDKLFTGAAIARSKLSCQCI